MIVLGLEDSCNAEVDVSSVEDDGGVDIVVVVVVEVVVVGSGVVESPETKYGVEVPGMFSNDVVGESEVDDISVVDVTFVVVDDDNLEVDE